MRSKLWLFACGLLGVGASTVTPVFAQFPPEESIQKLSVPEGFDLKVFASEPMIENPIAMDIDTQGRVWVTEGVNYRRNVTDPPNNKIKVLEDTDGDGVADKMTVFASDLNAAMGVCVAGSKIYVPESPNLYVYEDKNNDLIPDGPRTVLLTGWGGKNHDHGLHSQIFGPDHKLYMTQGDTSYDVTGPDGKHIKFQWGAMIRCEADGTKLEDFAVNFRNPFELSVDSFGNVWVSDNDNDGLKSVRICWILEGGNYGWFGGPENIRNPDGSFDPIHHWRADKPGFVPYTLITGFGSPCGMTFYEGNAFGPDFRSKVFHCDAGPQEVRTYGPQRLKGVGYAATAQNIVTGTDRYYRPVDVCTAPDGSLLINDWYDGGVGGHAYNDPTRGRIYRLSPKGQKLQRAEKPGPYANDADALVALASPNLATQFLARERLLASGKKAIPALTGAMKASTDRVLQARILWLLDRVGGAGLETVLSQLTSKDPEFRALAVRIARRHGDEYQPQILALANDVDGEVVKEVLLHIGQSKTDAAEAALLKLYGRYTGTDRYLLETLAIASRGREQKVFEQVVDRPDATVDGRLVEIVRILRPEDATKYLTSKLASANLPQAARDALLAALSTVSTAEAGQSILELLAQDVPVSVKQLALSALVKNLSGPWSDLKSSPALSAGLAASVKSPVLAVAALQVIGSAGLRDQGALVVQALQGNPAEPIVLAALDAATRLTIVEAAPVLPKLLSSPSAAVRQAALTALITIREPKTVTNLLTDNTVPVAARQEVAEGLVRSIDGAILLLRLIDTKKLDKGLADQTIVAAVDHPDVNVRLLFEKFIPEDQRPKTLGQSFTAEDILKLTGDAARGQNVFLRSGAASCIKCHRVKGQGADVGPDLSQIGRKYEKQALLATIMNPSLGIAPEYQPYVVATVSGRVHAGFLHAQTDREVTLKTIEGAMIQIPRDEIEELVKQEKSLMPELLLKSVTAQDAADLLAYLANLQEVELHATSFLALGPFPNDQGGQRTQDFGPEKESGKLDRSAKFKGLNGEVSWAPVTANVVSGQIPQLDLVKVAAEAKSRTERVNYYLAVRIDSTVAQAATFKIGSDDGLQVWLNGQKVHDHPATRALTPGEDKLEVQLQQGTNLVLLKIDQGQGPAGATFSVEARGNVTLGLP